jgi:hypothetical protein
VRRTRRTLQDARARGRRGAGVRAAVTKDGSWSACSRARRAARASASSASRLCGPMWRRTGPG